MTYFPARSPIEAAIDKATGYGSRGTEWDDEVARSVLNRFADRLMLTHHSFRTDDDARRYREAAAVIYFGARQAQGMRSERAFRTLVFRAARVAAGQAGITGHNTQEAHDLVAEATTALLERQALGR